MSDIRKARLATAWLDGCSGCHMSLLDMDERLLELAPLIDIVLSPYVDLKELPADGDCALLGDAPGNDAPIDVTLVEGAVSSQEDLHKVRELRRRTKYLIALGDCAVTGNVPAMRNFFPVDELFHRAYVETVDAPLPSEDGAYPSRYVPALRTHATPVHHVVPVDLFVPGCPPPADAIYHVLKEVLAGRRPDVSQLTRFGK